MIKKVLKFIWGCVEALIVVYVIFITSCILCRNKYGFTQFDKYTMVTMQEDTAKYVIDAEPGNLLVVKYTNDINAGDVIYYYASLNDVYVVKSGVVKSVTEGDTTSLYVLDDENKTSVASTRLLGKYANQYPTWGKVLDILESRFGFLFLVLLPIMIVFVYQVYEFVIILKYEKLEKVDDSKKDDSDDKVSLIQEDKKNKDSMIDNKETVIEDNKNSSVILEHKEQSDGIEIL